MTPKLPLGVLALIGVLSPVDWAQLPPVETGAFYVGDWANDRICVYDRSGAFLRDFTAAGLDGPRGICFLPGGRFLVASENGDEVFVFDRNEGFLSTFDAPGILDGPTSVALSPSGDEVYVGSFQNGSVCVFDLGGTFQRAFTAPGLTTVNCVAFDSSGAIFVSSASGSDDVFKFASDESLLFSFSAPGTTLQSSMGIAIDPNGFLYVAGGASHNICLFTGAGAFLGELTQAGMTGPQSIAIDDRGHFFTPSFFADRIFEFDPTGAHVQTITAGGLNTPRSIAFVQRRLNKGRFAGGVTVDTAPTRSPATAGWLFRLAGLR